MSRSPWALIRAPRAAITLLAAALAGCSAAPVDPSVVVGEKLGVETPYVSATIARGSHVAWKYGSTLSVYRDRAFVRAIELDLPIHAALAADDDFVYFATLAPGKFQTAAGEPTRKVGGLYRLRWDAAAPERLIDLPVVAGALTLAEGRLFVCWSAGANSVGQVAIVDLGDPKKSTAVSLEVNRFCAGAAPAGPDLHLAVFEDNEVRPGLARLPRAGGPLTRLGELPSSSFPCAGCFVRVGTETRIAVGDEVIALPATGAPVKLGAIPPSYRRSVGWLTDGGLAVGKAATSEKEGGEVCEGGAVLVLDAKTLQPKELSTTACGPTALSGDAAGVYYVDEQRKSTSGKDAYDVRLRFLPR